MLFNSLKFVIFFIIVFAVYIAVPRKIRYVWLLLASYYFYMSWNAKYAALIGISTLVTWASGGIITKYQKLSKKGIAKLTLAACIVFNLAILFAFKYFNFVSESVNQMFDFFNIHQQLMSFNVLLPVGISFYTFQALGYSIDVYRGKCRAEKNLLKYALFVSFFPQLVAGPIERSERLLTQIEESTIKKQITFDGVKSGLITMLWGFFLKMVVADRISILVDNVFNNYWQFGSVELILAAIGFSLQIYFDFSSYSTIAIGAAKVFGFSIMENFNTPYFSQDIKDFWSRWHISLSTWFRDYLYIPLGGNRCSKARHYFNLFITFLLSGLWHGANWTFVMWGSIHGIVQIIENWVKDYSKAHKIKSNIDGKLVADSFSIKFLRITINNIIVVTAWIFFRASSITDAFRFIGRIITKWNPWVIFDGSLYGIGLNYTETHILWLALLIVFIVSVLKYTKNINLAAWLDSQHYYFQVLVIAALFMFVIIYGQYGVNFDDTQFIYFQF